MNINEELCQYLKENEFEVFMQLWRKQYERYGRCGGTIHLPLTIENQEDISLLMGKDYHKQSHAVIAYQSLVKALKKTRFEDADFNVVLHLYFSDEIITHKSAKERKEEEIADFLNSICQGYENSYAQEWLQNVMMTRNNVYVRIAQEWKQKTGICKRGLREAMAAICQLPFWKKEKANVAIFASSITGNPHAFDRSTFSYYLLFQAICSYFGYTKFPYNAIEQNEILYEAGLYYDGVSNYCCVAHLQGLFKDGTAHLGWKGFYDCYEAFNATMDNLNQISWINRKKSEIVFVVENPSIFQALLKRARQLQYSSIGFICTYGQLNTSAYKLLDMIVKSGCKVYYAGDMDPEGLLIADRLKRRYKAHLHLWHYDEGDYIKANTSKMASAARIKMCEKIRNQQLRNVAQLISEFGIGYQENMLSVYVNDLEKQAMQQEKEYLKSK